MRAQTRAELREAEGQFLGFLLVRECVAARGEVFQDRFERWRHARLWRAVAIDGAFFGRLGHRACCAHEEHEKHRAKAHRFDPLGCR
jgi:hypothetical protein